MNVSLSYNNNNNINEKMSEVLRDECVIVPHVVLGKAGGAFSILVFYLKNILCIS